MLQEKKWRFAIVAVVLAVAAIVWTAVSSGEGRFLSPYCHGTAPVQKIFIEAAEGRFLPDNVNVSKGACAELWIRATSGIAHSAVIEGTEISSEGAPMFDHQGRRYGRAMARQNPHLSSVMLEEGWFAKGEQVLLRFQALRTGTYRLRCTVAESLSQTGLADVTHLQSMFARIVVSE